MSSLFESFKKNKVHIFFLFLIVFFHIYSIYFSFMPSLITTGRMVFVIGLIYMTFLMLKSNNIVIHKDMIRILFLFAIYFGWVSLRTILSGSVDTSYYQATLSLVSQVFITSLFIVILLNRLNFNFYNLIQLLQIVIFVQAIFVIISFLSDSFKQFTISIIPPSGNIDPMHQFRVRGIMQTSGAGAGALQSFGILFTFYIWWKSRVKSISKLYKLYLLTSLLLIGISVLLTGRTGILILLPIIIYIIIYSIILKKINKKLLQIIILTPIIIYGMFFLFQQLYNLTGGWITGWGEEGIDQIMRWIQSDFSLNTETRFYTINLLIQHHIMFPDNVKDFLFGDPATHFIQRIQSDIGYIRVLFSIGIIGLILFYGAFIYMLNKALKNLYHVTDKLLVLVTGLFLLVIEFKEPFIYDLRFASLYTIIFFFAIMANRKTIDFFKI